jgi:hypothetical protein
MSIKKNPRKKNSGQANVSVRMTSDRGPGSIVIAKKPGTGPATVDKSKKQ